MERIEPLSVCLITPSRDVYSETFIRAHIQCLPGRIRVLYGIPPTYKEDGHLLVSTHLAARLFTAATRRLLREPGDYCQRKALRRYLAANRIDVVLAEYGPTGVAVHDACARAGIPLVVHFHGFDAYHRPTLETYGQAYPRLFGAAAAVVAVSRDMERILLSLGAHRETLFYNPYGVDTTLFAGGDPAAARPVFVVVGRFVEKKAPHLVVLSFAEVRKTCPEAHMIMVGDGPLLGSTQHLACALDIGDAIEFLGSRPHSEVAAIMRRARAFVQHSLVAGDGDAEGTPVAILEAGATGLPVVSTRHGGIKEVVVHGGTGFLVAEGDAADMARYMIQLANDKELAGAMGCRARAYVRSDFSLERSIGSLWKILQRAVAEKSV